MTDKRCHWTAELLGVELKSWLASADGPLPDCDIELVLCGASLAADRCLALVQGQAPAWQTRFVNFDEGELFVLSSPQKPVIIMRAKALSAQQQRDGNALSPSPYAQSRDLIGRAFAETRKFKIKSLNLRFETCSEAEILGGLVGLELAAYTYKQSSLPIALGFQVAPAICKEAIALAMGTNIARHLVNSPPNKLYPESFAATVAKLFQAVPGMTVNVWDEARLEVEGMGLLLAVGQGSAHRPCLLHVRYRPETASSLAPLALVGKGITFDCGGIDIKDAAGMRLMKKDMGGAAAAVGVLYWLMQSKFDRALDLYLPLAENAISSSSYRPSDVITAKSGMTVEIHNTDAEGRLVLADAMAVACSQTGVDKPAAVMVVATLTGAIKIGLGADIAGYFSNDEALARAIAQSAQEMGDLMWRMPLFEGYRSRLETNVADINHCATGSYGGAITAALFLAEFANGLPFSHMDIYAWSDSERGALREVGGSGQAVQCLAGVLQKLNR